MAKKKSKKKIVYSTISGTANQLINNRNATNANQSSSGVMFNTLKKGNPIRYTANERIAQRKQDAERKYNETIEKLKAKKEQESQQREAARQANAQIFTNSVNRMKTAQAQQSMGLGNPFMPAGTKTRPAGNGLTGNEKVLNDKKTIMNNFLGAQAKKLQEQQEAYQKELDKANASKVFRDNNGFKSTGTRTTGKGLTGNEKALDSKDAITNRFVDAQKQKQLREVGTTYGKGHEGYENVRNDLGGKFTPIAYEEWTRDKFAKGGNYDLGYNPYYMSDQGQIQRRDEWQNLSKEAKEQAEKEKQYNETNIQAAKPYDKWGNVFDVTKRMDDRERRNVAEWERFANDEDNGEGDEDSTFFEVDLPKKYGERGEDEDSSVFLTFEKGPNGTYQFTEATGTTTGKRYSREEIDDLLGYGDPNPTGRQDAIDKAEDFFLNHYDQEWWESKWNDPYNGEENREKLRADLYDYIMPDTYADRVSRMTPAQKTELDSAIDEMVEEASGIAQRRWDESDDAARAEEAKARAYETKANEADAAVKEREEYNRLMAMTGDGMPSSEYDSSLAKATARTMQYQDAGGTNIQTYYQLSGSENDRIYFLINNPDAAVADSDDIKLQAKLKYATPDMTKKFTELYKYDLENGTNTAGEFYKAISGYLNDAYATGQDYITRAAAEDSSTAVGARLLTYPMQLVGGLAGGAETLRVAGAELSNNLFGTNYDTTPNMDMYALTQATQTVRDEQNQDIAEGLARMLTTDANGKINEKQYQKWKDRGVFLMNTFDSIVDNMISMYAAGGITGDKASKAGITLIQTMMSSEAISNTMLEKMDSGMKPGEAAWYAVGDGIIEWVTEKVSLEALLNPTVQTMLGDRKALTAYFLKAAGTEATEEMNADALNLGLDYLMSFLYEHENEITKRQDQLIVNGMDPEKALAQAWEEKLHQTGMSGLAGFISGAALSGGRIATNTFNQYLQGKQINANNQTEALIKAAQSNQVGPVSEGHANALEEKLLHGKKAKNTQVGKLSQAMQAEAMETLTSPDATDTDVGKSVRVLEALEEIRGNKEKTDAAKTGELWATQDSINEALRNGSKRITNGYEVIFDGKFAKLNKVVQDGKTGLKFEIETDNGTQTVDASALQATDFGIAAILRDVTATNKGLFSAGFVNTLLNVKQEGKVNNSGRLLMEATLLRLYAYADQRPPQNLSMPQKTAQALYDLSKSEHEANRAEQVRSNKGNVFKATLNGTIAYQSKTWNKWYGRLDQNARNQVDAIIGIAQRGNIEVSFNDLAEVAKINNISEEEAAKTYGWQLGNRIGINLAGEDVGTIEKQQVKNRHNMVISFAHEMTHWLQAHSLEGYNQLEKYVMDSLVKNNGMSQVSRMLNYYMANQGLNLEDAMSEVVANSCDQILMDESVQQHIQETNPGLYGEIKGFVKNLVQKLKNAMQNVDESASYESRNMMVYTNELAKRWLGAYDDALTAKIEQADGQQEEARYSRKKDIKNRSLTAAADSRAPASTSETTIGSSASNDILTRKERIVKREQERISKLTERERELDEEYMAAIRNGNLERQLQLIWDKISNTEGIYPFYAPHLHRGEYAKTALDIKKGDMKAIRKAAADMAKYVPSNAVLIPMPGHTGKVTNNSDTMLLAKELNRITKRPVYNVLEGNERESRYKDKKNKKYGVTAEQMGMRMTGELPEGSFPMIIDNVVSVGETAKAAIEAIKGSSILSYTKGNSENVVKGLKAAFVTKDKEENYIPLSQRINRENPNWRFSKAQTDIDLRQQELIQAWQNARDEANELREQFSPLKKEANNWAGRLYEAQKNGTFDDLMPAYKEWEKGYVQASNELADAEQRYKDANKAYDEYVEQRDVEAEQRQIEESGLSEADFRRKQAINEFGYTSDFREAGYLLPNGRMLNFTGEKGKHYGVRGEDHRGIGRIYASSKYQGSAAMIKFMNDGNIRVMAETPGIDIASKAEPTAEQYATIRNMARRFAGEEYFSVDFSDQNGDNVDSIEYDGRVDANRIVNDIKTFYKTGEAPQQSLVSQFHYSRLTEDAMDVNSWMMSQTPSSLQTEDEMTLVQAYKDLRINMSLSMKRISDYQAKIKQLEAKAQLTAEERDELIANRNRLEIQQKKLANYENELYKITSDEGFAGTMYRENMKFRDYIQGKTQDQVRQTVEDMLQQVQKAQEQMRKDTTALKKLAETQAVKTMRSFLGKSSLGEMATMLRKNYNSSMSKGEIMDRLAEISLKMASGMDVQSDTEVLAQDLLDKMRGIRSDALEQLRGTTLVIGQHLLNEIKAEHLTLKDLRAQLKGSGVTLKTEQNGRFVQTWNKLRENNMGLPDVNDMSESDALHTVLDYIQNEVKNSRGTAQYDANLDEMATVVRAAAANVTTYLSGDAKARAQINNLIKQIAELSSKTEKTAESLEALDKQMDEIVLAGMKAKGWTTVLQRDVNDAIKYYNKTAKVAAETERTKVRKALIEQLRSENTKKLIQQQDKFMERIKSERKARELYQDNSAIRRKIDKTAKKISKRLFNETDKQNVPEEAKPLARKVMEMLVTHDSLFRKVMFLDEDSLKDAAQRLLKMKQSFGTFDEETDLNWLVIGEGDIADTTLRDKVSENLGKIYSGLMEYRQAEGERNKSLEDRKEALTKVENALNEIWAVIMARSSAFINGQRMQIRELAEMMEEDMQKSLYKGERRGIGSKIKNAATGALNYGNMTPEYFFKNLKNRVMNMIKQGLNGGENRYGLEAERSRQRVKQIAAETGYGTWDGQEVHDLKVANGKTVKATTEQIMALYATWLREKNQLRPEETSHLLKGGFVLTQNDQDKGKPRREKENNRPIRISEAQLNRLGSYLTDQQKAWVDAIVKYMSGELAELGNEASMKMYGIKRFTEQYYFPIRSWSGVLNSRSDAGVKNNNENRAAQQSFTKRIRAYANNAVQISDFTPTAMKHISGMITYNTIGPEVENLNKVLNQQLEYGEVSYRDDGEIEENDRYKRNMRAAFQEAYGKQAYDYLTRFMKDLNGGITVDRTPFDRLLSVFKKNAVAGSLSVAAQQPLSYIRAAMMISPKYLAEAINPQYWKGSHAEMMKYSGLSVIKEMGKFDMNYGQTISDWITPEGKSTKVQKAWNTFNDKITSLPQMMDMMTWTRMWTAVKLEQMAQNKGADFTSDEFMQKVADRFNDLMRRTQVYDSVMVKSQNMRSTHWYAKTLTSFMAEPTLSLNVLEDAWANRKENGGKANVIRALATFMLSAAAQAGAKAFFGTGRSPDKKKNEEENFYYKFVYNLLSELNPLGLIPGYRQIIETMTDGELKDDAMGVIGKATEVVDNIWKLATTGKIGDRGLYRDLEDSVGQLLQLTTNVPAKNMMRDFRAMVNFFSGGAAEGMTGDTYAQRETSNAVLKYQLIDTLISNDLIGMINKRLQEAGAGYKTTTGAYYDRIYEAEKNGNTKAAEDMKEYVIKTSKAQDPEKVLSDKLNNMVKNDDSLTPEEKAKYIIENGSSDDSENDYVINLVKDGELKAEDARKMLKEIYPGKDDDSIWWQVDRAEFKQQTGKDAGSGNYYRLKDAIENGKQNDMTDVVQQMIQHGIKKESIQDWIGKKSTGYKPAYQNATGKEKDQLRLKLIKAYKATGMTEEEAAKKIASWTKEKKTK